MEQTHKKLNWWNIPRSDTRERCAECLLVIKKTDLVKKIPKFNGYRFQRVHLGCVKKQVVV